MNVQEEKVNDKQLEDWIKTTDVKLQNILKDDSNRELARLLYSTKLKKASSVLAVCKDVDGFRNLFEKDGYTIPNSIIGLVGDIFTSTDPKYSEKKAKEDMTGAERIVALKHLILEMLGYRKSDM